MCGFKFYCNCIVIREPRLIKSMCRFLIYTADERLKTDFLIVRNDIGEGMKVGDSGISPYLGIV